MLHSIEILLTEVFPHFDLQSLCKISQLNREYNELTEEIWVNKIRDEYPGALAFCPNGTNRIYYRDLKLANSVRCYLGSIYQETIQVNPYSFEETLSRIQKPPPDRIICPLDPWLWCVTDPQKIRRILYYPRNKPIDIEPLIEELVLPNSPDEVNFFGICQNNRLLFGWNRYETLRPLSNHSIITIGHAIRFLKVDLSEIPRGNINELYQQHICSFSNEIAVSTATVDLLLDIAKIPLPLISIAIEHRLRDIDRLLIDF